MPIYLVQHGKSLPKGIDQEKGLSGEGRAETEKTAGEAKEFGIHVSSILHSGKKRARQTAEILAEVLNPDEGVREMSGLNPMDDVSLVSETIENAENLMIVGHLPFLANLVSYLITGSVEKTVIKFQNSGILCLDINPDEKVWMIKWALMPEIV